MASDLLKRFGPIRVAREVQPGVLKELRNRAGNPLNALLLALASVSNALMTITAIICCVGIVLPYTGAGAILGLQPLPWQYWLLMLPFLVLYGLLVHWAKMPFVRRWGMQVVDLTLKRGNET